MCVVTITLWSIIHLSILFFVSSMYHCYILWRGIWNFSVHSNSSLNVTRALLSCSIYFCLLPNRLKNWLYTFRELWVDPVHLKPDFIKSLAVNLKFKIKIEQNVPFRKTFRNTLWSQTVMLLCIQGASNDVCQTKIEIWNWLKNNSRPVLATF